MKKILFGSLMVSFLLSPMVLFGQASIPPDTGFAAAEHLCPGSDRWITRCMFVSWPAECDPSIQEFC
ncbi:hypothetical protein [Aquiflexum gelatinilyticum]|uniref:Uncharacterized protein n=1 Tax=Aquiflexum gelatinilyticum TaxID=2961943 RepID=A0A9X2P2A3_9BACT|nr:hypothetical protein [Aquiflexum gelatinilyticum]MCR9014544.1 hypothetical protein [Aquiflexum gelatinilyticum]